MDSAEKKNILVVDDDREIVRAIALNLESEGYTVFKAYDGMEALDLAMTKDIHLIIIDVMMPRLDGLSAIMKIREKKNLPIIVLSAKSENSDKVIGLSMGADDYITKPFGPAELVARVDALHRRVTMFSAKPMENPDEVRSGPFVLNERSRTLTKNGKNIDLTQVEFQIMECFMKNPNVALERNSILSKVWGENYFGDVKIVDVNIRRLRMKIEDEPSNPKYLTTVWGFGYKWSVPE